MIFRKKKLIVAVTLALALSACGGDDDNLPSLTPASTPENPAPTVDNTSDNSIRYYLFASDDKGYVNVITDTAAGTVSHSNAILVKNKVETLGESTEGHHDMTDGMMSVKHAGEGHPTVTLGDVFINASTAAGDAAVNAATPNGKAYVIIRNGLVDDAESPIGGGVGVLDIAAVSHPSESAPSIDLHPFGSATHVSLVNHAVAEVGADGYSNHLWIMNDGPVAAADASDEEKAAASAPDSVIRLNWDHLDDLGADSSDLADDVYLDVTEIGVGDGHKAAVIAAISDTRNYVFVHNGADNTVSVIDNLITSETYKTVVKTIDLGEGNSPHGIAFSKIGNRVYIAVPHSEQAGLIIIDADQEPDLLTARFVATGNGVGEIPGSNSLSTSPDGRWLFVASYKEPVAGSVGSGYLTIVDAGLADAVVEVKHLGDLKPAKVDVASIDVDGKNILRLYISSKQGAEGDSVILVKDVDPETGLISDTAKTLAVGPTGHHPKSVISSDNKRIYFSFEGTCASEHGHDDAPSADQPSAGQPESGHDHSKTMPVDGAVVDGGVDGVHVDDGHGHDATPPADAAADPNPGVDGTPPSDTVGADAGGVHPDDGHDHGAAPPADGTVSDGTPVEPVPPADTAASTDASDVHADDGHDHAGAPPVDEAVGGTVSPAAAVEGEHMVEGDAHGSEAAAPAAMCSTIVAVDVLTNEMSAPVNTIGSVIKGMAVYVVPADANQGAGGVPDDHGDGDAGVETPSEPDPTDGGGAHVH